MMHLLGPRQDFAAAAAVVVEAVHSSVVEEHRILLDSVVADPTHIKSVAFLFMHSS